MRTLIAALIVVGGLGMGVGRADEPNVRLRPDGVVERFDWNEFRFVPTGSRFIPVRLRRAAALRIVLPAPAPAIPRFPTRIERPSWAAPLKVLPKVRIPTRFEANLRATEKRLYR